MAKESERLSDISINHPSSWDIEQFRAHWSVFIEALLKEEASTLIPSRRIRCQIEQTPAFREVVSGWGHLSGPGRLAAWKRLLLAAEEVCRTILPACVQCGECCRMGSPVLHLEDLPLLTSGKIPWDQVITLRRGEPARSPFDGRPFILPEERIKVREKKDMQECVFLSGETDQCSIYSDRPLQCRAQACWDPMPARDTAQLPFLLRKHIFEDEDLFLKIITEHENRCGFPALADAFERFGRNPSEENIQEVLGLLSLEEHFRDFVSEEFTIPGLNVELLFGRSFSEMIVLFGFRVVIESDGTRCVVADKSLEQG